MPNDTLTGAPHANDVLLRKQLVASFHDENVHGGLESIFAGVPAELRGAKPAGQPFTLWRILEHLRLCVVDFLDFCRVPGYVEPPFPWGYWPAEDAPPSDAAWERSLAGLRADMAELEAIILNPSTDLFAPIPGGKGRTVLRQALACLDHNAYHLGQALLVCRLLGVWSD
ncbi:MAG: DinB family protein [Acidobacteriaceae bacterium]